MRSEDDRSILRNERLSVAETNLQLGCDTTRKRKATLPKIVSLVAGAGGLDLGFKEAGFPISVAIDLAPGAIRTHKRNFPNTHSEVGDLIKLQPKGVLEIVKRVIPPGEHIAVIGVAPCQGF